jgi:hypothetical protein
MPASDPPPTTATIVVLLGGVAHPIAVVRAPRCDLTLVSDLLRLRLHGRRLGWEVELRDVDDRLRDLLTFIGFAPDGGAPPVDDEGDQRHEDDDPGD